MRFVSQELGNRSNGGVARVYLPEDPTEPVKRGKGFAYRSTVVEIDGEKRSLSFKVVDMLAKFSRNLEERTQLLQDCAVFALACAMNDSFEHRLFGEQASKAHVDEWAFKAPSAQAGFKREPEIGEGQIAFTVDASPLEQGFETKEHIFHLMVRATPWQTLGLYASKFGTDGPVALHGFDDTAAFYPVVAAGSIPKISLVEPTTRQQTNHK
jgi:hypothetical protein